MDENKADIKNTTDVANETVAETETETAAVPENRLEAESKTETADNSKNSMSAGNLRKLSKDTSPVKSGDVALKIIKGFFSFAWMLVISTVVAVCIWSYVFSIDNTEYKKTFKVAVDIRELDNVGEGELNIYSDEVFYADVTISGKRSDIYSLDSDNIKEHISLYVDASNVIGAGSTVLAIKSVVTSTSMDLNVGNISPSSVAVFADYETSKTLELRNEINYLLNSPLYEQYSASTELSVSKITITGPRSVVDTISYARVSMDLGSVSQSRNINKVPISFASADGEEVTSKYIESDNTTVDVKLMVETQRSVSISIVCGSNAEGLTASIYPSELLFKGDPAVLDALGNPFELNTEELFDVNEIKSGYVLLVDIYKIPLPDGVSLGKNSSSFLKVLFLRNTDSESGTSEVDG